MCNDSYSYVSRASLFTHRYHPYNRKEELSPSSMVTRIGETYESEFPKNRSEELCRRIRYASSFLKGLQITAREIRNEQAKVNRYILNALFEKLVPNDQHLSVAQDLFFSTFKTCGSSANANIMISKAGESENYGLVDEILEAAREERKIEGRTFAISIRIAEERRDIILARSLFNEAKERLLADSHVIGSYILTEGKIGDISFAKAAFDEAIETGSVTAKVFNDYLSVERRTMDLVREAYRTAIDKGIADRWTYIGYIHAATALNSIDDVRTGTREANTAIPGNVEILNTAMNAEFKIGDLAHAKVLFHEILRLGIATHVTYNTYIQNVEDFEEVSRVYEAAKDKRKVSERTFEFFIEKAMKNGEFEMAEEGLKSASRRGLANEMVYSAYIKAAGRANLAEKVKYAFANGIESPLSNKPFLYQAAIHAFGQVNDLDKIREVERLARESRNYTSLVKHAYIDALVVKNQIKDARDAYRKANIRLTSMLQTDGVQLDFHGFSPGSAALALENYIKENPFVSKIVAITGVGGRNNSQPLTFRTKLGERAHALIPLWTQELDEHNPGIIVFKKRRD